MIDEKKLFELISRIPLLNDPGKVPTVDDLIMLYRSEYARLRMASSDNNPAFWLRAIEQLYPQVRGGEKSNVELLLRKHKAYGGKSLLWAGSLGVVVRSMDKLARIQNLSSNPDIPDLKESIHDSWSDLFNYAVLGYLLTMGGIS